MNNSSMDKRETNFSSLEKTLKMKEIESKESVKKNEDSDLDEIKDDYDAIKLNIAKIIRNFDYYNSRSELSRDEVRRQMDLIYDNRFEQLPEMFQDTLIFMNFPGDNGRSITTKPDWFDMEKFKKGQSFAREYFSAICLGQLYGLVCLLSQEDGLKTMIITEKSHTPYLALNRYLSTIVRIRNWFTEDPWCEGTKANDDIHMVRKMHSAVRRKLCDLSYEEIDKITTIKDVCCPTFSIIKQDFSKSICPNTLANLYYTEYLTSSSRPKSLNQMDMSFTLFAFMGLIVLFPDEFNINASDEDLENFCHVWRSIAYLLGVEDDANFCRGSLEDIRRRGHEYIDVIIKPCFIHAQPQWEHMIRCVFQGFGYCFPLPQFEIVLLHITRLLNIEMPGLYASISYWVWIKEMLWKNLRYLIRFAITRRIFNKLLNMRLNRALSLDKTERAMLQEKSMKMMLHMTSSS